MVLHLHVVLTTEFAYGEMHKKNGRHYQTRQSLSLYLSLNQMHNLLPCKKKKEKSDIVPVPQLRDSVED